MPYLFLLTAVLLVYLWVNNPTTSFYTLQLVAIFIILYFLNQMKAKKPNNFINALIFTIVILLLVSTTGGLASPLFFLVYFLLFGTSLMLVPAMTVILSLALVLFFALLNPLDILDHLVSLLSLLFIAPLAMFFGKQYLRVLEDEKKIAVLAKTGRQLKKAIKKEETDSLMWLSLELKDGLLRIVEKASDLLSRPSEFSWRQKENLEEILASSQRLLRTGEQLKKEIDKATD